MADLQSLNYKNHLLFHWNLARDDVIDFIVQYYSSGKRDLPSFKTSEVTTVLYLTRQSWVAKAPKYLKPVYALGVEEALVQLHRPGQHPTTQAGLSTIIDSHGSLFDSVIASLQLVLATAMKESKAENAISMATGAFRSLEHRLSFIADTELRRTYVRGFAEAGRFHGKYHVRVVGQDSECEICQAHHGKTIPLNAGFSAHLPPFHPNCDCRLTFE